MVFLRALFWVFCKMEIEIGGGINSLGDFCLRGMWSGKGEWVATIVYFLFNLEGQNRNIFCLNLRILTQDAKGVILTPEFIQWLYIFFCRLFWALCFSVAEFLSFLGILAPFPWVRSNSDIFRGLSFLKISDFCIFKNRKMGQGQPRILLLLSFGSSSSKVIVRKSLITHFL